MIMKHNIQILLIASLAFIVGGGTFLFTVDTPTFNGVLSEICEAPKTEEASLPFCE